MLSYFVLLKNTTMKLALTVVSVLLFLSVSQSQTNKNTFYNLNEAFKNPQKVVKLDLSNQGITSLPDSVSQFKNLKHLDISGNYFRKLPEQISTLKNLRILDLSDNELTEIPIFLTNLKKLKSLDLTNNDRIASSTSVVLISEFKKLEKLAVSGEEDESVPGIISVMSSLKHLEISFKEMKYIPAGLINIEGLQSIVIKGASELKQDSLFAYLRRFKELKEIGIENCGLTKIPDGFANLNNLTLLNLSGNKIDSVGVDICKMQNLRMLDVRNNESGRKIRMEMFALLPSCHVLYDIPVMAKKIDPPLKGILVETQVFNITAGKDTVLPAKSGTLISIPANSLKDKYGNIVTGNVKVEYEEYTNATDVFLSGIPMTTNSEGTEYPFVSAGMFRLDVYKNGQALQPNLEAENRVAINLASPSNDPEMNEYFYDETQNNWVETGQNDLTKGKSVVMKPQPPFWRSNLDTLDKPELNIPEEPVAPVFDYEIYRCKTYITFAENNNRNVFKIAIPNNPRGEKLQKFHYKALKELAYLKEFSWRCSGESADAYKKFKTLTDNGKALTDISIEKKENTFTLTLELGRDTIKLDADPFSAKDFKLMFQYTKYKKLYDARTRLWDKIDNKYNKAYEEFAEKAKEYTEDVATWKDNKILAEKVYADSIKIFNQRNAMALREDSLAKIKYEKDLAAFNEKMKNYNDYQFTFSYDPEKLDDKVLRTIEPIRFGVANIDRLNKLPRENVLARFSDKENNPILPEFIYVLNDYMIGVSVFFGDSEISYQTDVNSRLVVIMPDKSFAMVDAKEFEKFVKNPENPIKIELINPEKTSLEEARTMLASK